MFASISVTASDSFGCSAPKRACSATRWRSSWLRTRSMHSASLMAACTLAPHRLSISVSAKSMAAPPQQLKWRPSISNRCGVRMARSVISSVSAYKAHGSAMRTPAITPASASHNTPAPTPPQNAAARQRSTTPRQSSERRSAWFSSATSSATCHWPGAASATCSGVRMSSSKVPVSLTASRKGCTRPAQVMASASPALTSKMRSGRSCARRDSLANGIERVDGHRIHEGDLFWRQRGRWPLGAPLAHYHTGDQQRRADQTGPRHRLAEPEVAEDGGASRLEGVDDGRLVGAAVALAPGLQRDDGGRGDHAEVNQIRRVAAHLIYLGVVATAEVNQ